MSRGDRMEYLDRDRPRPAGNQDRTNAKGI